MMPPVTLGGDASSMGTTGSISGSINNDVGFKNDTIAMSRSRSATPVTTGAASSKDIDTGVQDFYENLVKNQMTLTHGYVHGHIHKHKDHAHIHGHIHNHDHQHQSYLQQMQQNEQDKIQHFQENQNESQSFDLASFTNQPFDIDSCKQFENLDSCKDIFCDQLDDCYFTSCDDTRRDCSDTSKVGIDHTSADYNHFVGDGECCSPQQCEDDCEGAHCVEECDDECASDECHDECADEECLDNCGSVPRCDMDHGCNEEIIDNLDAIDCDLCSKKGDICHIPNCLDKTSSQDRNCCNFLPSPQIQTSSDSNFNQSPHKHNDFHHNNLCDLQLPNKPIFENLIENVHLQADLLDDSQPSKRRKVDESITLEEANKNFELHFPHSCHPVSVSGDKSLNDPTYHNLHQSNFHTKIPNIEASLSSEHDKMMSDFDFYIQFNNFKNFFSQHQQQPYQQQKPPIPELPSQQPKSSCKWDKCYRKVNEENLFQHLVSDHLDQEYQRPGNLDETPTQHFQCEWDDCNFMNDDFQSLVAHLNCHLEKHDTNQNVKSVDNISPILTPSSITKSTATSPNDSIVKPEPQGSKPFTITSMKISPKPKSSECHCTHGRSSAPASEISDFTCHWQLGEDDFGAPIHCAQKHETSGDLQHHLINEHIGSGRSVYHCRWIGCERNNGKHFTQRQKLLRHIHIHTNYKPCKCTICGTSFAVDSMLKQHMRIHSGEKPFCCNICGKRFATSSSLSIHNRVHTGEKPFVCKWPGCGKRFRECSNLTKHMHIHNRVFKCEVCGHEFDKRHTYSKHMKTHGEFVKAEMEGSKLTT